MKRFIIIIFVAFVSVVGTVNTAEGCGPYYDPDSEYYNLFMQEIIGDPVYYPFLLTYELGFYSGGDYKIPNENIEEWASYLDISYEQAEYLVYSSSRENIRALLAGKSVDDNEIAFVTPAFIRTNRQALLYLAYAKYLEPYMSITPSGNSWYYNESDEHAGNLEYAKVVSVLEKSWKAEKDNELKLRYGYQLVRFAHYNRRYEEAVFYFDKYVEPLNFRPAMYYHALSQMAGAKKGMGEYGDANYHFLQVFVHSRDLKTVAFQSMHIYSDADLENLLTMAKNEDERSNVYLLLGYNAFTNPLNEIRKILAMSPDAIQAKVLMARAVNEIERKSMPLYSYWQKEGSYDGVDDKRYPVIAPSSFAESTLQIIDQQVNSPDVKDKNFWYITAAYLYFLEKDFNRAYNYLARVDEVSDVYIRQKQSLAMYIDIARPKEITPLEENVLMTVYADFFVSEDNSNSYDDYQNGTEHFVRDLLANRYFLQGDYAKSFLLNNDLYVITNNPEPGLLDALEKFYHKPDKTEFEKYIALNIETRYPESRKASDLIHHVRGVYWLQRGDYEKAQLSFSKVSDEGQQYEISPRIFGVNISECFECPEETMMSNDYLSDFSFIGIDDFNYLKLSEILMMLQKAGKAKNEKGAKALYLLGNYIYNTSRMGYYRDILRFQSDNSNSYKYDFFAEPDIYSGIYFKYYETYYPNVIEPAEEYYRTALQNAKDKELKARVVFALSKCEQELYYDDKIVNRYTWIASDEILISKRKYFRELANYQDTDYFDEVQSKCKYFDYYMARVFKP